jgi:hypothetical protein
MNNLNINMELINLTGSAIMLRRGAWGLQCKGKLVGDYNGGQYTDYILIACMSMGEVVPCDAKRDFGVRSNLNSSLILCL